MHVVRILIEGIGQHAIAADADEGARFRESVKEVSDALVDGVTTAELLVHTGTVLKGLEEHNYRVTRYQRVQTTELQNMVKMLTSTVGIVSSASNANISILGDIERHIAHVSELDDVRLMKAKLSDCLADIRREADRQQKETGETIERLNEGLTQAREHCASESKGEPPDPITGLPLRPEAEAAIAQSGRAGPRAYAAVMVLDRLTVLNQRFGREVGDEILVEFTRMVQKQLEPEDQLFRWDGPALLALLPRPASLERVRADVGRLMENKLEHTIQTPSRSILIPISARWTLFPMMAAPRLMYQKIDVFAANPGTRS